MNLQKTREYLRETLEKHKDESPANTSLILLSHALNRPKSWVLAHGEHDLSLNENNTLQNCLQNLLQGVPLPYVLGHWDFYGRTFAVTPDVLIPRPETELLVELAIDHALRLSNPIIVDAGTGSGIIAISLAAELPSATIIALDIAGSALRIAQENARIHGQTRVHFVQSNLLQPFHAKFDLICANLPYIPTPTLASLRVSKIEPRLALDGGENGLEVINILLHQAKTRLANNGVILLEIDSNLGEESLSSAKIAFPKAQHRRICDLSGRDRIIEIRQE